MKLIADWKRVVRKAWSIRLLLLAGVLSAAEVALPFFGDTLPRGWFAALSALSVGAAFVARLVAQKSMSDDE